MSSPRSLVTLVGGIGRCAVGVAALTAALLSTACGRAGRPDADEAPAVPVAAPRAAARVVLTPEAIRQAGIATEIIRAAPFAATLSLPARLSPQPETPEEMEARLTFRAAAARYRRASSEVERVRKLAADNVASSKAVQTAEEEFAQAQVEQLRAETSLRNQGIDGAAESAAYPAADIWALAEAYEPQVMQLRPGARAWVRVESFPDEPFAARVVSLARSLKSQTRTLTVRIAVVDPKRRLRPQEPATADVEISEHAALSVPTPALLYEGNGQVLFRKVGAGGGAGFEKVRVRVGARSGGRAEILAGIADGDEVVIRGAQTLLGETLRSGIPGEGDEEGDQDAGGH
jgi:hypothetical protein